ncbi:MAG: hypothetical protein N2317_01085 [Syntrophales bacterium]|nr:hypothetical protein [Syntrophales bacterium]
MSVLKEAGIPIGRMLFIPKEEGLTKENLEIEANGQYQLIERPDCFIIKNAECCRSILVKVSKKD